MKLKLQKIVISFFTVFFLVGIVTSGYSAVICIGDDDHIELETICIPCCSDTEKTCQTEVVDTHHEEHSACSNCSDVDIDSPLWSKRIHKIDTKQSVSDICYLYATIPHLLPTIHINKHRIIDSVEVSSQSPPLVALSSIIIIC